ncbi:MAG: hypothetical protein PHU23_03150 [Dehalococcoidales bacterium]|nr:hypothetical protein [Dehalococcoidales bacterium]
MYEIKPDTVIKIGRSLKLIIRNQADELSDINKLLAKHQEREKDWTLMPAITFNAGFLYLRGDTESERLALYNLIEVTTPHLEAANEFLSSPSPRTPYDRKAMLFHAQLALATIQLIYGNRLIENISSNPANYGEGILLRTRALKLIKSLSSIGSFIDYEEFPYTQPRMRNVLTDEIFKSKIVANDFIYPLLINIQCQDPGEYLLYALSILKEPMVSLYLNESEVKLVDSISNATEIWIRQCQDQKGKDKYQVVLDWLDLITGVGSFLPYIKKDETRMSSPSMCGKDSISFWSWKLGYIIGQFIRSLSGSKKTVADIQNYLLKTISRRDWYEKSNLANDEKEIKELVPVVGAFLQGWNQNNNWNHIRAHAASMWIHLERSEKLSLYNITPRSDIYWAICVGIADAMIKESSSQSNIVESEEKPLRSNIDSLLASQDNDDPIDSSKMTKNPFPSPTAPQQEPYQYLQTKLGDVFPKLPARVVDHLVYCIKNKGTYTGISSAISEFDRSVRDCMQDILTNSLDRYAQQDKTFRYIQTRGRPRLPSGLSNAEWGSIFKSITQLKSCKEEYNSYRALFENYIKKNFPNLDLGMLRILAKKLLSIREIRNVDVYENNEANLETVKSYFNEMEDLVLGSENDTGVIADILKMFTIIPT